MVHALIMDEIFELRDAQWKTSVTGQTDCLVELLLNGFFLKYKIDANFYVLIILVCINIF